MTWLIENFRCEISCSNGEERTFEVKVKGQSLKRFHLNEVSFEPSSTACDMLNLIFDAETFDEIDSIAEHELEALEVDVKNI